MKEKSSRKFPEFSSRVLIQILRVFRSSDVNLVDGLPSARHTEAVWGPHGVFGPAAIGTLHKKMYEFERKCHMKLDRSFVQVKVCI